MLANLGQHAYLKSTCRILARVAGAVLKLKRDKERGKGIGFDSHKNRVFVIPDIDPNSLFVDLSVSSDMREEHPQGRGYLT